MERGRGRKRAGQHKCTLLTGRGARALSGVPSHAVSIWLAWLSAWGDLSLHCCRVFAVSSFAYGHCLREEGMPRHILEELLPSVYLLIPFWDKVAGSPKQDQAPWPARDPLSIPKCESQAARSCPGLQGFPGLELSLKPRNPGKTERSWSLGYLRPLDQQNPKVAGTGSKNVTSRS